MLHRSIVIGDNHIIHNWEVANAAARLTLGILVSDEGKVARQLDTGDFYILLSAASNEWQVLNPATSVSIVSQRIISDSKKAASFNKAATNVFMYRNFS